MPENVVLIFLKYPQPGLVKTRLAKQIGPDKAACIYKNIAEQIVASIAGTQDHGYDTRLCFSPADSEAHMRTWLGPEQHLHLQQGKDLGERMRRAVEESLAAGYQQAIIMGSDCPGVTREIVSRGFELLGTHDVVIGPALDGGYYLLGLKVCRPELFSGIAWGTEAVLSQTQAKICRLHLTCGLLPMLRDIDLLEDWEWYCREHRCDLNP